MNVGYLAHLIKIVNMFQLTVLPHNQVIHLLKLDLDHMLWSAMCNYRWHYFLLVVLVIGGQYRLNMCE